MEDEMLDIVDENDNVVGQDTKDNKFCRNLISRNVAIFIVDRDGKLLIARRSEKKKSFPGRYDLAACGNVKVGESYQNAAARELEEELGVKCDLTFLGKMFNEFNQNIVTIRYFTGIFIGHYHGEVKPNDELVEIKRLMIKEIEGLVEDDPSRFTPGFVKDFDTRKAQIEQFITDMKRRRL